MYVINTGEKMRKNLSDVMAAIATNINESAESTITSVLLINKKYTQ